MTAVSYSKEFILSMLSHHYMLYHWIMTTTYSINNDKQISYCYRIQFRADIDGRYNNLP